MALNDKHAKNIGQIMAFNRWKSSAKNGAEYVCPNCGKVIAIKRDHKIQQVGGDCR